MTTPISASKLELSMALAFSKQLRARSSQLGRSPLFTHAMPWKYNSVEAGLAECSAFCASANKGSVQCARYAGDNLILHLKHIARFIKTIGP